MAQPELDRLVRGDSDEAAEPGAGDVQHYDFRRPNLVSKDRMRSLEALYGLLANSLEGWITSKLRTQADVAVVSVEQLSYGEFVLSLTNPCAAYVFDIGETTQQAVIDFGPDLAFLLIDRLLGSNGAPVAFPRGLSPVERMIVRLVADRVAEQVQEIWQDHVQLGLRLSRFESMPDMLQTSSREEPVLVTQLEVAAAGIRSTISISLPFTVLERFFMQGAGRVRGGRQRSERDARTAEVLARSIGVDVIARFAPFDVSLSHLRTILPGSVLRSPLQPNASLSIWAAGKLIGEGQPGRAANHLAVCCTALHLSGAAAPQPRRKPLSNNLNAEALALGELGAGTSPRDSAPLASLLHLTLPVTIELGRTRMTLQEILELGRGSVIQLERLVGEPIDVLVGDRHFAEGEVVVIGEQFGVRITKLAHTGEVAQA